MLLFVILSSVLCCAETPSDIANEPHYHLLLKNEQVRIFGLTLERGEQAYVQHDHNFLTITLQDCEVILWQGVQAPIQNFPFRQGDVRFTYGGMAIGIRNDRDAEYRNIIVEFLSPKVESIGYQGNSGTWGYTEGGMNLPADPHVKNIGGFDLQAAFVEEAQLLPDDLFPTPKKPADELMIPITDVDLKSQDTRIRKTTGQVFWMGAGRESDLANNGADPQSFVVVQFWKQPSE